MIRGCGRRGRRELLTVWWEYPKKGNLKEDLGVDWNMILKWMLNWMGLWVRSVLLRMGTSG